MEYYADGLCACRLREYRKVKQVGAGVRTAVTGTTHLLHGTQDVAYIYIYISVVLTYKKKKETPKFGPPKKLEKFQNFFKVVIGTERSLNMLIEPNSLIIYYFQFHFFFGEKKMFEKISYFLIFGRHVIGKRIFISLASLTIS